MNWKKKQDFDRKIKGGKRMKRRRGSSSSITITWMEDSIVNPCPRKKEVWVENNLIYI